MMSHLQTFIVLVCFVAFSLSANPDDARNVTEMIQVLNNNMIESIQIYINRSVN